MFGEDTGVDKHTWNDWLMLASNISEYHNYIPKKWGKEVSEKQREFEEIYREKYRGCFEGKIVTRDYTGKVVGEHEIPYRSVVRPYSDRLKLSGINLDSLIPEDEEKINQERESKGKKRLDWERVRRLDELAKRCNESLRLTIYQNMPFEWKKLYSACREANEIIYGKGPADEFFEGLVIKD